MMCLAVVPVATGSVAPASARTARIDPGLPVLSMTTVEEQLNGILIPGALDGMLAAFSRGRSAAAFWVFRRDLLHGRDALTRSAFDWLGATLTVLGWYSRKPDACTGWDRLGSAAPHPRAD